MTYLEELHKECLILRERRSRCAIIPFIDYLKGLTLNSAVIRNGVDRARALELRSEVNEYIKQHNLNTAKGRGPYTRRT